MVNRKWLVVFFLTFMSAGIFRHTVVAQEDSSYGSSTYSSSSSSASVRPIDECENIVRKFTNSLSARNVVNDELISRFQEFLEGVWECIKKRLNEISECYSGTSNELVAFSSQARDLFSEISSSVKSMLHYCEYCREVGVETPIEVFRRVPETVSTLGLRIKELSNLLDGSESQSSSSSSSSVLRPKMLELLRKLSCLIAASFHHYEKTLVGVLNAQSSCSCCSCCGLRKRCVLRCVNCKQTCSDGCSCQQDDDLYRDLSRRKACMNIIAGCLECAIWGTVCTGSLLQTLSKCPGSPESIAGWACVGCGLCCQQISSRCFSGSSSISEMLSNLLEEFEYSVDEAFYQAPKSSSTSTLAPQTGSVVSLTALPAPIQPMQR